MVFIMVKCFDFKRLRGEFVVRGSEFGVRFFTADSTDVAKLSGGVEGVFSVVLRIERRIKNEE